MANSINTVTLSGRIGTDLELKTIKTKSGDEFHVLEFRMATDFPIKPKNKGDKWETGTDWHNIKLTNRDAKFVAEYGRKGAHITVQGPLKTRQWEDKQGNKRYTTEVHARTVVLPKTGDGGGQSNGQSRQRANDHSQAPRRVQQAAQDASYFDGGDELPF